jgi:transposase
MGIMEEVVRAWKTLGRNERAFLVLTAARGEDAMFRAHCQYIRNLARGRSVNEVAEFAGCQAKTVRKWARRFLEEGVAGLVDRREDNGQVRVHEGYVSVVLAAVAKSPQDFGYLRPTWTQELLVLVAADQTQIQISCSTMSRLLKVLGVRHGRPKPYVTCPWSKHKKSRRLNEIRRVEENLPPKSVLLYVDEVDIHLNPKIGPDWMLRGQQKQIGTPGQNAKWYLAGALNARTGRICWVEGPRKTGALFIALVDHLVSRAYSGTETIHLVLDNFKIHDSQAVRAAKTRWGDRVVFHFLPPYCPDHNRIERVWKDLHDNVTRNHTRHTLPDLLNDVNAYLNQRRRSGKHSLIKAESGRNESRKAI